MLKYDEVGGGCGNKTTTTYIHGMDNYFFTLNDGAGSVGMTSLIL